MGIRFYKSGDEQQIQALFKKVFRKDRSMEYWKWKYISPPNQENPWILVYEEADQIIGHIALWISEAFISGETKKVGLRIDTMVDPDARGKGIYKALNKAMIEKAKQSDIAILYGFPAPKAKELLLRYTDGIHVADITRYYMVLKPWAIASSLHKIAKPFKIFDGFIQAGRLKKVKTSMPPELEVEIVGHCNDRFDSLAEQVKTIKPIIVKRNAAYLNWRYINHPENNYTILALNESGKLRGYVVVRKETVKKKSGELNLGFIVDWLAVDNNYWQYLMQNAITYLVDTDLIQAWSFPENQAVETMKAFGLKERDKPMPFIVHDLGTENSNQDQVNWWLTQGDVDSF